jgi:hypothetical protein
MMVDADVARYGGADRCDTVTGIRDSRGTRGGSSRRDMTGWSGSAGVRGARGARHPYPRFDPNACLR